MSALVSVALFGWPLVVVALFVTMRPLKAILVAYVGAWMFLPQADFAIPGLPDYGKIPAASLGVLAGVLAFDTAKVTRHRFGLVDVPLIAWLCAPIASSMSNGLGIYDGLSEAWALFLSWGVPMLIGRLYFNTPAALRELASALVVGAMVYTPLCLLEVRLSPQLHRWVYGFHPHEFDEAIRYGGFRPMVFMDNGLAVATFMACGAFLCFWLWRTKAFTALLSVPLVAATPVLMVTTVLCKSANGVATCLLGIAAYFVFRAAPSKYWLLLLALVPPTYIAMRASGALTAASLESMAATIDEDRAHSLGARLKQEELFTARARPRIVFGWGGWMRNFPRNEQGEIAVRGVDGMWTIAISKHGVFGLTAWMLTMLVGPVLYALRVPARMWMRVELVPATALAVLALLWAVDNLFNALLQPMFILAMGGLASYAIEGAKLSRQAARKRRFDRPVVGGRAVAPVRTL